MPTDKLRAHLARLIKGLRETGICLLDQMEAEGEISHEDRRTFQYVFCGGMGDAHFIMEKPKEALASNRSISKDRQISSTIESGIRMRAEDLLETILGENWRQWECVEDDLRLLDTRIGKQCGGFSERLVALHKALRAKPSEVREQLDQRITIKCSHCHQPGHEARLCPFKQH